MKTLVTDALGATEADLNTFRSLGIWLSYLNNFFVNEGNRLRLMKAIRDNLKQFC